MSKRQRWHGQYRLLLSYCHLLLFSSNICQTGIVGAVSDAFALLAQNQM
jgi:hypothetical protein